MLETTALQLGKNLLGVESRKFSRFGIFAIRCATHLPIVQILQICVVTYHGFFKWQQRELCTALAMTNSTYTQLHVPIYICTVYKCIYYKPPAPAAPPPFPLPRAAAVLAKQNKLRANNAASNGNKLKNKQKSKCTATILNNKCADPAPFCERKKEEQETDDRVCCRKMHCECSARKNAANGFLQPPQQQNNDFDVANDAKPPRPLAACCPTLH